MRQRLVFAVLLFLVAVPLLAKDEKWFEVSSEHFLLFTNTNEMKGRRLVSDLENRVAAFAQTFGKIPPRQFPIEILLFNNEQDFVEALPRVKPQQTPLGQPDLKGQEQLAKTAYMLRGPDRVFIIAKDKSPDDIANDVAHALGHVFFERYVVWRPFWLAEGAAEYMRRVGRAADTKAISEQDGFSAADILTIVPSATYNDNDPPTVFRAQSYRVLRILLDEKPDVLKQYFQSLRTQSDAAPRIQLETDALNVRLQSYVETPLKFPAVAPAVKSGEADMAKVAIHRGDVLLATDRAPECLTLLIG